MGGAFVPTARSGLLLPTSHSGESSMLPTVRAGMRSSSPRWLVKASADTSPSPPRVPATDEPAMRFSLLTRKRRRNCMCSRDSTTSYNFWTKVAGVSSEDAQEDWILEVWRDGRLVMRQDGAFVPVNFWNGRKQIQFSLEGTGNVTLVVRLKNGASAEREMPRIRI